MTMNMESLMLAAVFAHCCLFVCGHSIENLDDYSHNKIDESEMEFGTGHRPNCRFEDVSYLQKVSGEKPGTCKSMLPFANYVLQNNYRIADPCRRMRNINNIPKEFDFIVVGGGVAGSVVASRLSENKKWKVLLLEAGPEEPSTTGVPAFSQSAVGSELDWQYKTEPEGQACLDTGGVCDWPRGKMLGGTGSMTGMMYTRGHKDIYDSWAEQGIYGWSYNECLHFYKKSECNKNPEFIEKPYHGKHGPLVVQRFSYQPEFAYNIIKAGVELGYRVGDLNGKNQTGFTIAQVMVEDGIRASTPRMYLRPNYGRKNLFVKINSRVTRIIFDDYLKKAKKVEFLDNLGVKRVVKAKKEIILSAGAVGSPHLLLLSGIGPQEDLIKHDIKPIQNLKVGYNLHNHISIAIEFLINDKRQNISTKEEILKEYAVNGTGPMACTGITQVTAFLRSNYADHIPDLQFFFDGFETGCRLYAKNINRETKITIRPVHLKPLSRGYLTLKSSDPLEYPLIYPGYFNERSDVDILIDGIKKAIELSETKALKEWDVKLNPVPKKKCAHLPFASDIYWECIVRTYTGPENHQGGSCKMGPSNVDSVVDPELRVHGIPNLRVIDASIFPEPINCNTLGPTVMAAEKGAYMIRETWSN